MDKLMNPSGQNRHWSLRLSLAAALVFGGSSAFAIVVGGLGVVEDLHDPQAVHVEQDDLVALIQAGDNQEAFQIAFELGDELFETKFNALDGSGANVGQGQRFTRVPRADLTGPGEWANHFPERATGPNGQACNECHAAPFGTAAGNANSLVHRDPLHSADLGQFIERDTPHLFGAGALQRLAEEITEELHALRDSLEIQVCNTGQAKTKKLDAKGVSYGVLEGQPAGSGGSCTAQFDFSAVEGVDDDLVIRPLQWKGNTVSIRDFNRGASHNELGMQAVELVGYNQDGDFDGVVDELTVGDQTAMAIYIAGQPRPTTREELASLGLTAPLSNAEKQAINRGKAVFNNAGCTECHLPSMRLDDPVFSEPSQNANYRDQTFPAGLDPISEGVDPAIAVVFDLTQDLPDNIIEDAFGNVVFRLGNFEQNGQSSAIVRLFGDLKRHDMGPGLAEQIDEADTGAATFMTKELWGVGSTAPYLHDGRATTLTEAILEHGGEAADERDNFTALGLGKQADLIAYLENLVLFKAEE